MFSLKKTYLGMLVLVMIPAVWSVDDKYDDLPLWKTILVKYRKWSGSYSHGQSRFMCSMSVHSVQYNNDGVATISFVAGDTRIEMNGFSNDNRTVVFKEVHIWNKSGHFEGQSDLVFTGTFLPDTVFYKYEATVASKEMPKYGSITLIPSVAAPTTPKPKGKGFGLAMAIGIPMFVGSIIFTISCFIIVWAVRKGYLRHVPKWYRSFRNPKERPEPETRGDEMKPVSMEGIHALVHM